MPESTTIAQPIDLGQRLRDKVRELFANLIPDDQLEKMIDTEWKRFAVGKYNEPSDLDRMVKLEVEKKAKAAVDSAMSTHCWNPDFNDEFMEKMIIAAVPEVMRTLSEIIVREAAQAVRNALQYRSSY